MNCLKCGTEIIDLDMSVDYAGHSDEIIEVNIVCPECDAFYYGYVNVSDLTQDT